MSGPFSRRKRCEAGVQGLQAHEKKYAPENPALALDLRFVLVTVFFFVWLGLDSFGRGPV